MSSIIDKKLFYFRNEALPHRYDSDNPLYERNVVKLSQIAQKRFQEKELEIRSIAQKMGYFFYDKMTVGLEADVFTSNASSVSENKQPGAVFIPSFYLIKPSDIPEQLKIKNSDDPKLKSDDYLQQVADWVQDFLGLPKQVLNIQQKSELKFNLRCLIDPDKAKKIQEFIEAHETAHLYYQHSEIKGANKKALIPFLQRSVGSALVGGVLLTILLFLFPPSGVFLLLAVGMSVVAAGGAYCIFKRLQIAHFSRGCEAQADMKAYQALGTSIGGQSIFELSDRYYNQENRFFSHHPTYIQRLKMAQSFAQDQHQHFYEQGTFYDYSISSS